MSYLRSATVVSIASPSVRYVRPPPLRKNKWIVVTVFQSPLRRGTSSDGLSIRGSRTRLKHFNPLYYGALFRIAGLGMYDQARDVFQSPLIGALITDHHA